MTRRIKFITSIVGLASSAALIFGFATGPDPRETGAPGDDPLSCATSGCHSDSALNAGGGNVVVNFPNGPTYTPGVQQTLTIIITDSAAKAWGFQMTARLDSNLSNGQAGDFTAGAGQFVLCENSSFKGSKGCPANAPVQFVEHSNPFTTNTITITWTPPATDMGGIHIYVAAIAANKDGNDTGDHTYTANYALTPQSAGPPKPCLANCTFAYVANNGANSVSVINTSTRSVVATIPVGSSPTKLAISPSRKHVLVTNQSGGSVSIISTASNTVITTVAVGSAPVGVAITPDSKLAYVTLAGEDAVVVVDLNTFLVTGRVAVGPAPVRVNITPNGAFAYVSNQNSNFISFIDTATKTVAGTLVVGAGPYGTQFTPDGTRAYAAVVGANLVAVIDTGTRKVLTSVAVGSGPTDVAITPDGSFVYVNNQQSNNVSVIDTATNTVVKTIAVGLSPADVAMSPNQRLVYVSNNAAGTESIVDTTTNAVIGSVPVGMHPVGVILADIPLMSVSRTSLNFGVIGSLVTSPQTVALTFTGIAGASWTASANQPNITVGPPSGSGNGTFQVTAAAGVSGVVTVTAPGAVNSPLQIQISVTNTSPANPIGSFDTPTNGGSGIVGAIPVTGWALDNLEVVGVDIWREPITGEPSGNLIFIGTAVFVADARPDVQGMFPTYPYQYRAGWGYQMLTNFLPNASGSSAPGTGTYKIHAIAHNKSGSHLDLGTKTISVDNAHSAKPFGTLDTPSQGGTISGTDSVNFGWALTPQPFYIPLDGSTMTVVIDGMVVGHPTYNQFRSDIATLFPGYGNSMGAVGFFHINTATLTNGVHTISWNAFDNGSRGEGLGSRYFNVLNLGNGGGAAVPENVISESVADEGVRVRHGLDIDRKPQPVAPDADGVYSVTMEEVGHIEIHLAATTGNILVLGESRALPIGSSLKGGVFYWQPGPGFLGEYSMEFQRSDGTRIAVRVNIVPKRSSVQ